MTTLNTPLDVYKLLPKSNCGQCGIATCLGFSAAVIKQEKQLKECPYLDSSLVAGFEGKIDKQVNLESIQEKTLKDLAEKISAIDLLSRAERIGARIKNDAIVIQCLGKEFEIDQKAAVKSHCHTHAWFSIPLLDYILSSKGTDVSGRWVPFRELKNGQNWSRLFERRCEAPLKQIADSHADLFGDLVTMFSGKSSQSNFNSDISVILYPFPKVPILICYWKPEDGMESKLHLFFDDTAESHLHIDSVFTLGTGIVRMIEKIMLKHTNLKSILP